VTDIAVIPLHGFNAAQETALHKIRMARLADNAFTGGERLGLRLSIDDPVRRVKAYFDRFWRLNFDEGISSRGYWIEDLIEIAVMQDTRGVYGGAPYVTQVPIEWGPRGAGSVSAFDFVAHHDLRDLPVSVKSKDTGVPIDKMKPSTSNVRQEVRMLIEAGYPPGAEWHTWMGSLGEMAARGPFVHHLGGADAEPAVQKYVAAYAAEREGVAAAFAHFAEVERRGRDVMSDPLWNDPSAWFNHFGLRTTSGAFRYTHLTADPQVEARHVANMDARAAAKEADAEKDRTKAAVEKHVREQIALARRDDPKARSIDAYSAAGKVVTYTLTSNDQIRVTEKDAPASAAA